MIKNNWYLQPPYPPNKALVVKTALLYTRRQAPPSTEPIIPQVQREASRRRTKTGYITNPPHESSLVINDSCTHKLLSGFFKCLEWERVSDLGTIANASAGLVSEYFLGNSRSTLPQPPNPRFDYFKNRRVDRTPYHFQATIQTRGCIERPFPQASLSLRQNSTASENF